MKILKSIITLILAIFIFNASGTFAQQTRLTESQIKQMHHEISDDAYLPNAFGNSKTSPAYRYQNQKRTKSTATSIFTIQVNVDADGNNIEGDAANEPSIAVNPLNDQEIVIGWRQFDNIESNFRQAGRAFTHNGGESWISAGVFEPGIFRSDPVLGCDADGNFYYNSLTNDPGYFCKVFKSKDGGLSWDEGTEAKGGDKQWMTIDRTEGEGRGNIYSFWTSYFSTCPPGFFTRSTDENDSYEDCVTIDGYPYWGTMAVGNEGEVFITGAIGQGATGENQNVVVAKSLNARTPGAEILWEEAVLINLDGNLSGWTSINPQGLLGQADIDVDRSEGNSRGNIYVLASVQRTSNSDPADVMFVRSTDGGSTWSDPVKINDDESLTNFQWFGTMSVAPNGRIDVIWLDTRDAPAPSDSSALYYSYSTDYGLSWSANERLSELFDPHIGYPNQDKMGDYFDMVSDDRGAHLAWANTFNGEEDVCYSYIIPPGSDGVNQNSIKNTISVYPNPAFSTIIIKGLTQQSEIDLYNIIGDRVMSFSFSASIVEIDISSQPAGLYFLKISDQDGRTVVKKLVKE